MIKFHKESFFKAPSPNCSRSMSWQKSWQNDSDTSMLELNVKFTESMVYFNSFPWFIIMLTCAINNFIDIGAKHIGLVIKWLNELWFCRKMDTPEDLLILKVCLFFLLYTKIMGHYKWSTMSIFVMAMKLMHQHNL